MNVIESLQKKYIPGFYESRYQSRKALALSLKEKCLKDPSQLSLYEIKIILKVLQQFKILSKQPRLQQKEKALRIEIVQHSIQSSIVSLLPFIVREFHRKRFLPKILTVAGIFVGVDYLLMRGSFNEYIQECRNVAQRNIDQLIQACSLPE